MTPLEGFTYQLSQAARLAWFRAHAQLAGRLAPPLLEPPEIRGALPSHEAMRADLFRLLRRDRANIEAGHYRPPPACPPIPLPALGRSLRFLADLGAIDRRRRARIDDDLGTAAAADGALPRLLPAQLPLSDRRLSERAFGGALRLPGRGAVQRRRRRDAPPGAGADRASTCAAGGSATSACSTSPAAPAASSRWSSTTSRACR